MQNTLEHIKDECVITEKIFTKPRLGILYCCILLAILIGICLILLPCKQILNCPAKPYGNCSVQTYIYFLNVKHVFPVQAIRNAYIREDYSGRLATQDVLLAFKGAKDLLFYNTFSKTDALSTVNTINQYIQSHYSFPLLIEENEGASKMCASILGIVIIYLLILSSVQNQSRWMFSQGKVFIKRRLLFGLIQQNMQYQISDINKLHQTRAYKGFKISIVLKDGKKNAIGLFDIDEAQSIYNWLTIQLGLDS